MSERPQCSNLDPLVGKCGWCRKPIVIGALHACTGRPPRFVPVYGTGGNMPQGGGSNV